MKENFWWIVGSVLAGFVSWNTYQSVAWAIVHGCFSWFYIIYFALTQS